MSGKMSKLGKLFTRLLKFISGLGGCKDGYDYIVATQLTLSEWKDPEIKIYILKKNKSQIYATTVKTGPMTS